MPAINGNRPGEAVARADLAHAISRSAATAAERILFALSPEERELFLPGFSQEGFAGQEIGWYCCKTKNNGDWEETLRSFSPTILVTNWSTPPIPQRFLERRDCALRYVCHMSGSIRGLVPRMFLENGGLATNWGETVGAQVAEHALLLALSAMRSMPAWRDYIRDVPAADKWPIVDLKTISLFDAAVGLHGFGHVARMLVRLLEPFHVTIHGYSEGVSREWLEKHGVIPCDSLASLFSKSSVLFECEALTRSSEGSVDAKVLAALPDGAIFVNVGRGRVVEEAALLCEARSGRIRVALDVVACEPMTPDSQPYREPNVVLSPHIGGPTLDRLDRCGKFAVENIRRYLAKQPLQGVVSLGIFDRST